MGKIALNNGALSGLISVAITLLGTLLGWYSIETQSSEGLGTMDFGSALVTILGLVVSIYFIVRAMKEYRTALAPESLTYGNGLLIGLYTAVVASLVSAVYILIHIYLIEPNGLEAMRENMLMEMEDNGLQGQELETAQMFMDFFMSPVFWFLSTLFGGVFMGLIISLIASAFVKNN